MRIYLLITQSDPATKFDREAEDNTERAMISWTRGSREGGSYVSRVAMRRSAAPGMGTPAGKILRSALSEERAERSFGRLYSLSL